MYASDLTLKKRAQAVYSDISRQKALFSQGAIFRINYQKGGTDYSYMMELEQGCINNKCFLGGVTELASVNEDGKTSMDLTGATYMDLALSIDYAYAIPGTIDDGIVLLTMGTTSFYFFGTEYNASNPLFWSSNCAILFEDPGTALASIQSNNSMYVTSVNLPHGAILLGNGDRRLDNLYVRDDSKNGFSILTIFVFYEDFTSTTSTPNTGVYQVRIIRELTGLRRQWIEVRVSVAPTNPGYIAGQGVDTYGTTIDPTKLSPYNITNGTNFLNLCGTTFSTVGPPAGTSFTFESDSTGSSWGFQNHTYVPV